MANLTDMPAEIWHKILAEIHPRVETLPLRYICRDLHSKSKRTNSRRYRVEMSRDKYTLAAISSMQRVMENQRPGEPRILYCTVCTRVKGTGDFPDRDRGYLEKRVRRRCMECVTKIRPRADGTSSLAEAVVVDKVKMARCNMCRVIFSGEDGTRVCKPFGAATESRFCRGCWVDTFCGGVWETGLKK